MTEGCSEKLDAEIVRRVLYKGRTKKKRALLDSVRKQYPEKTQIIRTAAELNRLERGEAKL